MGKNEKKDKLKLSTLWKETSFCLSYVLRYAPAALFGGLIIYSFADAGLSALYVLFMKYLFESISLGARLKETLLFAGIFFLLQIPYSSIVCYFQQKIINPGIRRASAALECKLYKKAYSLELSCYEDPSFYNEFSFALEGADRQIESAYWLFMNLVDCILNVAAMVTVVATISPVYMVFPICAAVIAVLASLRENRLIYEFRRDRKPYDRKREYFKRLFYMPDYAKELRLSDGAGLLRRRFGESIEALKEYDLKKAKPLAVITFITEFIVNSFFSDIAPTAYCIYEVLCKNSMTVAEASALITTTNRISENICNVVWCFGKLSNTAYEVEKIRTFLSYEAEMKNGTLPAPEEPKEIRFEKVCFCYKGSDKKVLDGVDLTLSPGQSLALVGFNGAGKTTLIKLLLRLYDPTEGRILLDGHDLREYEISSLRGYFGCVFQDFVLFAATLGENVLCREADEKDREAVQRALILAGFEKRLSEMEKGIDTPITKEFEKDGINLSGGENQKIAMARCFAKDCWCMVLDEPSAALDPISEYNLNKSMEAAAEGKTVVYISHRLSTTRMATCIFMMEKGKIIEKGSHEELMHIPGGRYAEMFETQSTRYLSENTEA